MVPSFQLDLAEMNNVYTKEPFYYQWMKATSCQCLAAFAALRQAAFAAYLLKLVDKQIETIQTDECEFLRFDSNMHAVAL